jgi:hypothetical protein
MALLLLAALLVLCFPVVAVVTLVALPGLAGWGVVLALTVALILGTLPVGRD